MFMLLFCLLITALLPNMANANFPQYDTTPEIDYCMKNKSMEECAKDAIRPELNLIKIQYRMVLSDKTLLEWRNNIAGNKQFFYDMYESWTAYRNRVCALYKLSAQYSGSFVDDEISCTLGQMQQHKYYMQSLVRLLTGDTPKKQSEFEMLRFEHDDEYKECTKNKKTDDGVNCLKEETQRTVDGILEAYKKAFMDEMLSDWNNGPNLQNGNFRDMYDSWLAYRNRYCSIAVWAYRRVYGDKSISMNYCLERFNKNNLILMEDILASSHSFLDEEMLDDDDADYLKPKAAGELITPLERRFDKLEGFNDAELKNVEEEDIAAQPKPVDPIDESDPELPGWAKDSN